MSSSERISKEGFFGVWLGAILFYVLSGYVIIPRFSIKDACCHSNILTPEKSNFLTSIFLISAFRMSALNMDNPSYSLGEKSVFVRSASSKLTLVKMTATNLLPDKSHFCKYTPSKLEYLKSVLVRYAELNKTVRLTTLTKFANWKLHPWARESFIVIGRNSSLFRRI